jgi:hypothetical protein
MLIREDLRSPLRVLRLQAVLLTLGAIVVLLEDVPDPYDLADPKDLVKAIAQYLLPAGLGNLALGVAAAALLGFVVSGQLRRALPSVDAWLDLRTQGAGDRLARDNQAAFTVWLLDAALLGEQVRLVIDAGTAGSHGRTVSVACIALVCLFAVISAVAVGRLLPRWRHGLGPREVAATVWTVLIVAPLPDVAGVSLDQLRFAMWLLLAVYAAALTMRDQPAVSRAAGSRPR